jgi:hypothetical protein
LADFIKNCTVEADWITLCDDVMAL